MGLYYKDSLLSIYNDDCLELMSQMPKGSFDLIVTDPPYNFSNSSVGNGKINPWGDLMNSSYWFSAWIKEALRILKEDGALWTFLNWRSLPTITKAVFDTGNQIESLLVWDKICIGTGGLRGLRPSYELVALICKPEFRVKDRSLADIKKCHWPSIRKTGHSAEKPVELFGWIIEISNPKSKILDPFCGSGTSLVAASRFGLQAVGIEINEEYCQLTKDRISQVQMSF